MEITRFADLRPRTVWDVVDDSFDLYRSRLALLAGVSAAAYVPILLLLLGIGIGPFTRFVHQTARSGPGSGEAASAALLQLVGATLLAFPLLQVAQSLQTAATSVIVEAQLSGRNATIVSAWRRVLPKLFPVLFTACLGGLVCGLAGLVSGGVGELLVAPFFLYLPQAILLERQGIVGAFRRSSALSQYGYGRSLGLVLLTRFLGSILGLGLLAIVMTLLSLVPGDSGTDRTLDSVAVFVVLAFGAGIATVLIAPILGVASTLLYYDLRVRREGIDIEAAAVDMGYPIAPDYFGGVAENPAPRLTKPIPARQAAVRRP